MATASVATLRSQIEVALRGRVPAPFTYRDRNMLEVVSTGIPEMDACFGGLPRSAMTEICGPACSGRTSLLLSALATRTADGEVCALVDARDSFDPMSAAAAGVALKQLLWVRCQNIDQALRATDLLIQGGGFGLVAVDLSDVPARLARQVPLNAWFRFRRAVEDTPTILLLLGQESNAKTCASLVLRLDTQHVHWSTAAEQTEVSLQGLKPSKIRPFMSDPADAFGAQRAHLKVRPPKEKANHPIEPFATRPLLHDVVSSGGGGYQPQRRASQHNRALAPEVRLLRGYRVGSEVVRSRIQIDANSGFENQFVAKKKSTEIGAFQTRVIWSDFNEARNRNDFKG
jgi:recombination protein RecA